MIQKSINHLDSQKLISGFAHFYHNKLLLGVLLIGYYFVVSTLSIPARLILRKNMGERAFAIPAFLVVIGVMIYYLTLLFTFLILLIPGGLFERLGTSLSFSNWTFENFLLNLQLFLLSPFVIFLITLLRRAIGHFKYHLRNAKNNIIGYSVHRGESRYFKRRREGKIFGFTVNEDIHRMLVEPFGLLKISLLLAGLSITVLILRGVYPSSGIFIELLDVIVFGTLAIGITLIISSIALGLEEYAIMQKERQTILDMVDGEFEMERILALKEKLKVKLPKKVNEVVVENHLPIQNIES